MLWWFWAQDPSTVADFCASIASELSFDAEQFELVLNILLRQAGENLPDHVTREEYVSMRVRVFTEAPGRANKAGPSREAAGPPSRSREQAPHPRI